MSAREQADSVRQSRKAFKRSLCRLFLKGLKEQSGGRDGERVGGGGGELSPAPHFPPAVVGCGPGGWLFMFLAISIA